MIINVLLMPKKTSVEHLELEVRSTRTRSDYSARVLFYIATLDFRPCLERHRSFRCSQVTDNLYLGIWCSCGSLISSGLTPRTAEMLGGSLL
jgi:hypothetical protein